MKKISFVSLFLLTILGLNVTSCGLFEGVFSQTTPTPKIITQTPTQLPPPPTLTPTPEILYDCFIQFYLSAWIDSNNNGLWDVTEEPLPEVEFHIDGQFALVNSHYPGISNEKGQTRLEVWYPAKCEAGDYTITAIAPAMYEATTPDSLDVYLNSDEFSAEVEFGFMADSNE